MKKIMKIKYEKLDFELVKIDSEDIVTSSKSPNQDDNDF